jgi:glyoxylase-like metal-dependent hydrolase (beta-lactamase superfamily II)
MDKLTDHIYILPGHDSEGPNPKIVLLTGKESSLLIDVSNDPKQLDEVLAFQKKEGLSAVKFVALTHFHDDHIGNLIYLPDGIEILASKNTARYLNRPARILAEDTILDLGDYPLSLILVPSLHAKGCLDVLAERYLFVGDSLYYRQSGSSYYYNPQIAYEMLKKVESIPFEVAISAHESPNHTKSEVVTYLTRLAHDGLQTDWE